VQIPVLAIHDDVPGNKLSTMVRLTLVSLTIGCASFWTGLASSTDNI